MGQQPVPALSPSQIAAAEKKVFAKRKCRGQNTMRGGFEPSSTRKKKILLV